VAETRPKPSADLRRIGSSMVRTKYQRGSPKKIGNGQYIGRWRRYTRTPSGEKATPRKKIITKELTAKYRIAQNYPGPLTQSDAQRLLDILIAEDTGKYLAPDFAATFEQLARQYIFVEEPRWGGGEVESSRRSHNQKRHSEAPDWQPWTSARGRIDRRGDPGVYQWLSVQRRESLSPPKSCHALARHPGSGGRAQDYPMPKLIVYMLCTRFSWLER
jgi:hypothetical protein